MSNSQSRSENGASTVWQIVGRLVAAAVVLAITAFFSFSMAFCAFSIASAHSFITDSRLLLHFSHPDFLSIIYGH